MYSRFSDLIFCIFGELLDSELIVVFDALCREMRYRDLFDKLKAFESEDIEK